MEVEVRFRGELAGEDIRPDVWLAADERLLKLRNRLAEIKVEGEKLGQRRAQTLVERLIVGALDDYGNKYMRAMGEHLEAIVRIRRELSQRLASVFRHFQKGKVPSKLPKTVVDIAELTRLFNELDQHLDAISGKDGTKALEDFYYGRHPDARPRKPTDALAHATGEEWATEMGRVEEARAGEPEPEGFEPDPKLLEPVQEDVPGYLKRGEGGKAEAAVYRERRALEAQRFRGTEVLPSKAPEVQRARQVLREWSEHALPDGWESNIRQVADYTEPMAAQFAETGQRDANFARAHVEVWLKTPDGHWFGTDGVRFEDPAGNNYLFMEHKDPPSTTDIADFISEKGREKMRADMYNDARVAKALERVERVEGGVTKVTSCKGWVYSTSSSEVAKAMAEEIGEIRKYSPDLGRFLHPPEYRGP
jgi:hypothetical protein